MGFFSNVKIAQAVAPQEGVDPQQNLQNLESSGFLGKALANAFRSRAISKLIAPVSAAQEAAAAATPPPTTTNAYSVSPQNISIGETRYRALPVNMLSRLSLSSLKDILSMYDKEGENVMKMAEGGEVDRPELIAQLGRVPSASATVQPTDMADVARQVLSGSTSKNPADFPALQAPPGYRMADRGLEELGFVSRECGPMGCVGFQVVTDYANPKTGEYVTLGTPFQGQLPEGWVKVNPTSYDAEGNVMGGGPPKRIYGETGPIEQMPIAPNPVALTAPESPYQVNLGPSQSMPQSQPTAQAPRPVYQMPQYQAQPMPGYLQDYVDRTRDTNAPLQADLMDFLRRQRMV